jgi:hypothetical protein
MAEDEAYRYVEFLSAENQLTEKLVPALALM